MIIDKNSLKNIIIPPEDIHFDFDRAGQKRKIKKISLVSGTICAIFLIAFFGFKYISAKISNFTFPLKINTSSIEPIVQPEIVNTINDLPEPTLPAPVPPLKNTTKSTVKPSVTITPTQTPLVAPPATQPDWKLCTNSQFSYTIKYPNEWDCEISNPASVYLRDSKYSWFISQASPALQADQEFLIMNSGVNIAVIDMGEMTLDQLIFSYGFMTDAIPIKFANYDGYIGTSKNLKRNQIVIKKDNNIFVFNLSDSIDTMPIKTILASFSFTN